MNKKLTQRERIEIYQLHTDTWGADSQKVIAVEEMSELTKELCKSWRHQANGRTEQNAQDIQEEIADVLNMAEQLEYIYGIDEIEDIRDKKLRRGLDRIAKWKEDQSHDNSTK